MKKIVLSFGLFFCILLTACDSVADSLFDWRDMIPGNHQYGSEYRPDNVEDSKWSCRETEFVFNVFSDESNDSQTVVEGVCGKTNVRIEFTMDKQMLVFEVLEEETRLCMKGRCKFEEKQMVVLIDRETDELLRGKYETLTFDKIC